MKITLLENNEEIRRKFVDRFVMSWDEFQVELKAFIDEMSKKNQVVDIEFYNRSYLWDKISSKYSRVSSFVFVLFFSQYSNSHHLNKSSIKSITIVSYLAYFVGFVIISLITFTVSAQL